VTGGRQLRGSLQPRPRFLLPEPVFVSSRTVFIIIIIVILIWFEFGFRVWGLGFKDVCLVPEAVLGR